MEKPRACKTISEIAVGDRFEREYRITDDDVLAFAKLSGDFNPVHFDDEYAATTLFKRRIAHGMISLAKFSGIFGMDLPGLGTLWLSQTVSFLKPVYIGESYTAVATVASVDRRSVAIDTDVVDQNGERVIQGSGVVIPISDQARRRIASSYQGGV